MNSQRTCLFKVLETLLVWGGLFWIAGVSFELYAFQAHVGFIEALRAFVIATWLYIFCLGVLAMSPIVLVVRAKTTCSPVHSSQRDTRSLRSNEELIIQEGRKRKHAV